MRDERKGVDRPLRVGAHEGCEERDTPLTRQQRRHLKHRDGALALLVRGDVRLRARRRRGGRLRVRGHVEPDTLLHPARLGGAGVTTASRPISSRNSDDGEANGGVGASPGSPAAKPSIALATDNWFVSNLCRRASRRARSRASPAAGSAGAFGAAVRRSRLVPRVKGLEGKSKNIQSSYRDGDRPTMW